MEKMSTQVAVDKLRQAAESFNPEDPSLQQIAQDTGQLLGQETVRPALSRLHLILRALPVRQSLSFLLGLANGIFRPTRRS